MFDVYYTGTKPNLFAFERPAESIEDAQSQSRTNYCWFVDGNNNYSDFDFDWRPRPDQADYVHCWPSQWQRSGGTFLIPKHTAELKWHWHTDPVIKRQQSAPIVYLDFLNPESKQGFNILTEQWRDIKSTRYVDNHLTVLKRIAATATTDYVWVVSSICDYSTFDFTWHPAQWQETMLHVFPSGNQSRGDTFFMNVAEFKKQAPNLELLDWYNVINYSADQTVRRYAPETVVYNTDDLPAAITQHKFNWPYAVFTDQAHSASIDTDVCIWREKDRTVVSYNKSNSIALVPKDIKNYLSTQVYDYPYIIKTSSAVTNKDLDIVYISNGEVDEERWYNRTCEVSQQSVKWIRGINGRAAAYQAAAAASNTPWFFTVFAKIQVVESFDWTWQPDYFQEPKHYIFNAQNPVNRLEYGHMGVIAYNKQLVLSNNNPGLDFTLSQPHESVPVLSAIAHFNADPWMTWRTAFREVLKLKYFSETQPTVETAYRLNVWLSRAEGLNAEWAIKGAADAVKYYNEVAGNYQELTKSFDWDWLRTKFNVKDCE